MMLPIKVRIDVPLQWIPPVVEPVLFVMVEKLTCSTPSCRAMPPKPLLLVVLPLTVG